MSKAQAPHQSAEFREAAAHRSSSLTGIETAFAGRRPEAVPRQGLAEAITGSPRVLQQKALFDGIGNSPRAAQQKALMDQVANSPRVFQQKAFSESIRNSPRMVAQRKRMDSLFGGPAQRRETGELAGEPQTAQRVQAEAAVSPFASSPGPPAQLAVPERKSNDTGLPDGLKAGVESLSGVSLDNVKVHYNSSQPAQLNALAYARGSDIHVAPRQERHLPHEAWHAVQQAQGRVQPTMQMKNGAAVNDDRALEHEADTMGAKALSQAAQLAGGPEREKLPQGPSSGAVAQLVDKTIGRNVGPEPVITKVRVGMEAGSDYFYAWPSDPANLQFRAEDYAGSVTRAMNWGAAGGEGTAGWYARLYQPLAFHKIAQAAQFATEEMEGIGPLNNESSKTLVAIRAFRGPEGGAMAGATLDDLRAIQAKAQETRPGLADAHLINNADAAITEIKADPAEAHPNTLPTARITFGGAGTVYFKGRSKSVEDALVGTGNSAAQAISDLAGGGAEAAVGRHGFIGDATSQFGADVGSYAGGVAPTQEAALGGWLSAAKTALLVSLTGTADLHDSNLIGGRSGKKHIIDAEFLLDATAWTKYEAAVGLARSHNFAMSSMAPAWLTDYTHALGADEKGGLANQVVEAFTALHLAEDAAQEAILAPIRAMMADDVLLRVSPDPFVTMFWLSQVSEHHNMTEHERAGHADRVWGWMQEDYPEMHIDLENEVLAKKQLQSNFENGMVPLFHLKSATGHFMLNKLLKIGQLRPDRSIAAFLDLTKRTVTQGHEDILQKIRNTIVAI